MKDSKTTASDRAEKRDQQKKDKEYKQLLKDVKELKELARGLSRQNKAQEQSIRWLKSMVANQGQLIQQLQNKSRR